MYVKVGLFIGFIQVTIYELRKDFVLVIFGPKTYLPSPFDKVEKFNDSTKLMTILRSSVYCESKEGTVADETIQCWEKKDNPVIMTELNVARLEASGSLSNIDLNCILSETDMKGSDIIKFNWERCLVQSGEIVIGGKKLVGVGITNYSNLKQASIILPTPPQDFLLTTVGNDCTSAWELTGSTDLKIKGREAKIGCFVDAPGNLADGAVLTIDFDLDLGSCGSGYFVVIDENEVYIGTRGSMSYLVVQFGQKFRDIVIIMSPCDDFVQIKKTYDDSSYVEIVG